MTTHPAHPAPAAGTGHGPPDPETLAAEARAAFHDHLRGKADAARLKHGLYIDAGTIRRMLDDRDVVRYPVTLCFDAAPLQPHEFAWARPLGFHASDGFVLFVHPHFEHQPENLALLVAYHIPIINYGDVADEEGAEIYGAALLGIERELYYQALCELADSIPRPAPD